MDNLKIPVFSKILCSQDEWKNIFITSASLGIVLFFNEWHSTDFTIMDGVLACIVYIILSFIFLFLSIIVQKQASKKLGLSAKYTQNPNQTFIGLFFTTVSTGWLMITTPGHVEFSENKHTRIGQFRSGINRSDTGKITLFGNLSLLVALVLSLIIFGRDVEFFLFVNKAILLLGMLMLVPATKNSGLYLFIWNYGIHISLVALWVLIGIFALPDPFTMVNIVISALILGFISILELLPKIYSS